jgi:hypothetical protein
MATRSTLRNSRGGLPPSPVAESVDSTESRNRVLNDNPRCHGGIVATNRSRIENAGPAFLNRVLSLAARRWGAEEQSMRSSIRVEWMRHAVEQHWLLQKQGSPHRLAIVELRYARAAVPKGAAMRAHRHCGRELGNENKHTKSVASKRVMERTNRSCSSGTTNCCKALAAIGST